MVRRVRVGSSCLNAWHATYLCTPKSGALCRRAHARITVDIPCFAQTHETVRACTSLWFDVRNAILAAQLP